MEITIITGTKLRHEYFINLLKGVSKKLNVIYEIPDFSRKIDSKFKSSKKNKNLYFKKLRFFEKKVFKHKKINLKNNNFKKYCLSSRELDSKKIEILKEINKSDLYILYGCSKIKNRLYNFLKNKNTLCIHMGLLPFYAGSDCNFWAINDDKTHLVGSTILKLSKNYEKGKILYHALPPYKKNPLEHSILASKAAFHSIVEKIKNKSLLKLKLIKQETKLQIRNSKKKEFDEKTLKKFFLSGIRTKKERYNPSLLKDPFFLKK